LLGKRNANKNFKKNIPSGIFLLSSVIPFMSIEIFQLLMGATFTGSIAGLAFVIYKIITEEQERKLEKSKVKLHWREHRELCKQTLRSRGD